MYFNVINTMNMNISEELNNIVNCLVSYGQIITKEQLRVLPSLEIHVQKLLEFIKKPWISVPDPIQCHVTISAEIAAELLQKLLGCHFQLVWTAIGERGQHDIIGMLKEFLTRSSDPESKKHKDLIQMCISIAHNLLNFEEWYDLQQFILMEKFSVQENNKALEIIQGSPGILRIGLPGFNSGQVLIRAIEMFQRTLKSEFYSVKVNAAKSYAVFLACTYLDQDTWKASETVLLQPLSDFLEAIQLSVFNYTESELLKVGRNLAQDCPPISRGYPYQLYNSILRPCMDIVRDFEIDEQCRKIAMQSILLILELGWAEIESSLRQDCYQLALQTMTERIPEGQTLNKFFYRSIKTECLAGVAGWGVYELIDQNKGVEQFRLEIHNHLGSHGRQDLNTEINITLNSINDHENREQFLGILGAIWIEVEKERHTEKTRLHEIWSSKSFFKVPMEDEILSYLSEVYINDLLWNN